MQLVWTSFIVPQKQKFIAEHQRRQETSIVHTETDCILYKGDIHTFWVP